MEVIKEFHNGNARLCRDIEYDDYFDVFGEPEGYENRDGEWVSPQEERAEIEDLIEREGLYYYYVERRCKCCGQWETTDSIGMVIGDIDSDYRADLMASAKE